MNPCKDLCLKTFSFSLSIVLLIFLTVFLDDGINANSDAASAADQDHHLAAEIATLKEKLMEDGIVDSIYPCNLSPTPADEKICLMILKWNKNVQKVPFRDTRMSFYFYFIQLLETNGFRHTLPPVSPAFVLNKEEQTPSEAEERYHCMDLLCICPLLKGKIEEIVGDMDQQKCVLENGKTLEQAVRKEYRMLTKEERRALHQTFHYISMGEVKEFERFAIMHKEDRGPSAHGGPAFLPWHREYLKRMEIALRRTNSTVALAYWDVTLDAPLDNPVIR